MAENDYSLATNPNASLLRPGANCLQIETVIKHPQEVNRARYNPKAYNVIATKANDAGVYLWDYSKHPTHPSDDILKPQMVLEGQEDVGFALDWSNFKPGLVLSGSNKGDACLWDVQGGSPEIKTREGGLTRRDGSGARKSPQNRAPQRGSQRRQVPQQAP